MRFLKNNWNCIISFFIIFVFILGFMIVCGIAPFGRFNFVIYDCAHQIYPYICVLYDKLKSGESLFYYWNCGLGGDYLSTYFNYLASPLNLFVILVDRSQILHFITFLIVLKIAFSGFSFCYFINKKYEGSKGLISISFSCAYALSGFIISYYHESMWLDAIMLFPIIMCGYNELVKRKKIALYVITLTISAYCSFYMAYIIGLFLVIVFFLDEYESIKDFLGRALWFGAASLMSLGMSFVSIFVIALRVKSTHVGSEEAVSHQWYGSFIDIFKQLFLFSKVSPIGESLNSANIYAGVFTIVFSIAFFFTSEISIKRKLKRLFLILLLFISMNESVLNYIWHGFHRPMMVPNRFAFLFIFVLLDISYEAYASLKKKDFNRIIISSAIAMLFPILVFIFGQISGFISEKFMLAVMLMLILIYGLLFAAISKSESRKKIWMSILSLCMLLEILCNFVPSLISEAYLFKDYYSEVGSFDLAVSEVKNEENGFYRSEIEYTTKQNEDFYNINAICGINGINTFNSMCPSDYLEFMYLHGGFMSINLTYGKGYTECLEDIFSEKYIFTYKNNDCYGERGNYKKIYENDNVTAYKNQDAFSLGFAVDKNIMNYKPEINGQFNNLNNLTDCMAVCGDIYEEVYPEYAIELDNAEIDLFDEPYLGYYYHSIDANENGVAISFNTVKSGEHYLALDKTAISKCEIYKNGELVRTDSVGTAGILYIGRYEKDDNIVIKLINNDNMERNEDVKIRVAVLDEEKYQSFVEITKSKNMKILEMKDNYFKGEIELKDNEMLFTSILYDEGWHIFEDGKEISKEKLANAFLGINPGSGKHILEFKYVTPGFYIGVIVSIVSLVIFIIFLIFNYSHNKEGEEDLKILGEINE